MKNKQRMVAMVMAMIALPAWAVDISVTIGDAFGTKSGQKTEVKSAPPDHAPAYGYRKKHQYRYYPSSEVYFDSGRSLYFYYSSGKWQVSANLPNAFRIRLGNSVSLEMESDKPYTEHAQHKAKYPPGQAKKKHQQKEHHKNGNGNHKHK